MKKSLPEVTLVAVDCVSPNAAAMAMEKSLNRCDFVRHILFTHKESGLKNKNLHVEYIPNLDSIEKYCEFLLKHLPLYVKSSYALVIQWDGYVVNESAWNDSFYQYDYIGARWGDGPSLKAGVGNGGFSLRSKTLLNACFDIGFKGAECMPEDAVISCYCRNILEKKYGIKYAPEELADDFSHEDLGRKDGKTGIIPFGFHGLHNIPLHEPFEEFVKIIEAVGPRCHKNLFRTAKKYQEMAKNEEALWVLEKYLSANPTDENVQTLKKDLLLCPKML